MSLGIFPQRAGVEGIHDTLTHMVALVNRRYLNPLIRSQAAAAIQYCAPDNRACQLAAILTWTRRHMQYVKDPVGMEALYDPLQVALAIKQGIRPYGDCDDFSIFIATLMKSVGLQPTFRAVGFRGMPISHVYVLGPRGEKLDGIRNDWNPTPGELLPETSWMERKV